MIGKKIVISESLIMPP